MINDRLDVMEKDHRSLVGQVSSLQSDMALVKAEQTHIKELFTARLLLIERSNELQLTRLDQISKDINTMGSDSDKTPMGRQLGSFIRAVQATVDEQGEKLEQHSRVHADLIKWQNSVETVINFIKWVGFIGIVTIGIQILRLFKILP